jgi:hypothetical protein
MTSHLVEILLPTTTGDGQPKPPMISPPIVFTFASSPSSSSGGSLRWPISSLTASTRNWLIRLDLPDPEMPVTLVKTPSGISAFR